MLERTPNNEELIKGTIAFGGVDLKDIPSEIKISTLKELGIEK